MKWGSSLQVFCLSRRILFIWVRFTSSQEFEALWIVERLKQVIRESANRFPLLCLSFKTTKSKSQKGSVFCLRIDATENPSWMQCLCTCTDWLSHKEIKLIVKRVCNTTERKLGSLLHYCAFLVTTKGLVRLLEIRQRGKQRIRLHCLVLCVAKNRRLLCVEGYW